jgi:hypothetical protein
VPLMCRDPGNWTERNGTKRHETGSHFATISRRTPAKFAFRKGLMENCGQGFDSRDLRLRIAVARVASRAFMTESFGLSGVFGKLRPRFPAAAAGEPNGPPAGGKLQIKAPAAPSRCRPR